jgi:NTE family protein
VIAELARRLSETVGPTAKAATAIRTLAVITAGGSRPSHRFVDSLGEVFGTASRAVFLSERKVTARFAGASIDDATSSNWLNSLEVDSEFYIGDHTLTDWTRKCIRQADALLLVAEAGASPELNSSELFAFSVHPRLARRLVILHEHRTQIASGTSSWLERREVHMHHHVALQDSADVRRLFRFLSGRAVGFVAGGGGALGIAHLGAYKAFCEAGADFDIFGGTSSGAAMMAGLAYGWDPERVDDGTHNIFVRSRAFRRPHCHSMG